MTVSVSNTIMPKEHTNQNPKKFKLTNPQILNQRTQIQQIFKSTNPKPKNPTINKHKTHQSSNQQNP